MIFGRSCRHSIRCWWYFAVGGSSETPASSETSDVEGSADGSAAGAAGSGNAVVPFICTPPIGSKYN